MFLFQMYSARLAGDLPPHLAHDPLGGNVPAHARGSSCPSVRRCQVTSTRGSAPQCVDPQNSKELRPSMRSMTAGLRLLLTPGPEMVIRNLGVPVSFHSSHLAPERCVSRQGTLSAASTWANAERCCSSKTVAARSAAFADRVPAPAASSAGFVARRAWRSASAWDFLDFLDDHHDTDPKNVEMPAATQAGTLPQSATR